MEQFVATHLFSAKQEVFFPFFSKTINTLDEQHQHHHRPQHHKHNYKQEQATTRDERQHQSRDRFPERTAVRSIECCRADFQAVVFALSRPQTFTTFCRALLIPGTLETTDVHRLLQSSFNPASQAEASSRPSGKCSECVHGGLSRAVVFFLGRTCLLLIFHLGPCPNQRLCC